MTHTTRTASYSTLTAWALVVTWLCINAETAPRLAIGLGVYITALACVILGALLIGKTSK